MLDPNDRQVVCPGCGWDWASCCRIAPLCEERYLQGARKRLSLLQSLDLGSSDVTLLTVPERAALCCARISHDVGTGWCMLSDLHAGDHAGVLSAPLPPPSYSPRRVR
jgi:hypothetical protein